MTIKGVVHGKTIELTEAPGLPDGQSVSVTLRPLTVPPSPTDSATLERLKRAAGTWADDPEGLDEFLEWSRQQRKGTRPEIPE